MVESLIAPDLFLYFFVSLFDGLCRRTPYSVLRNAKDTWSSLDLWNDGGRQFDGGDDQTHDNQQLV